MEYCANKDILDFQEKVRRNIKDGYPEDLPQFDALRLVSSWVILS